MTTTKPIPLGSFETDLAFFRDEPFRDYTPQFGVEQQDEKTIWLTDHGRRIALIDKPNYKVDLFEFWPGRPPRVANPQKPPVYHAPTYLGARISLAQRIGGFGRSSTTCQLELEERADRIVLQMVERWDKPARQSTKRIELIVHPRWGYVLLTADALQSSEPVGVELYNFLVQGLTHHAPGKRRFPVEVWHSAAHGLLRWTSNMVTLRCAGQRPDSPTRNLGTTGWLGFLGEPDWNPVFALAEANHACTLATCDNLLDEHFVFEAPPTSPKGQPYSLTCRGALVILPGAVAQTLIDGAKVNDLRADEPPFAWPGQGRPRVRPFCLNQVCDFEQSIPLDSYFRGTFWDVDENGSGWATVTDEQAHSGRWSLRLRVQPADGEKSIFAPGSTLWLDSGRTYRLSAWVRYVGTAPGQFRLCTSQAYFGWVENREPQEARVTGADASAWHRLEVNFRTIANDPCVFVQLKPSGHGDWFVDDILLEEADRR